MARLLAAVLLSLTLTLHLASRSVAQKKGFHSINCGGKAYVDPTTNITWEGDPSTENAYAFGKAGRVNVNSPKITKVMQSLRYFPNDNLEGRKFCYNFTADGGETYLIRASFLYGNYDKLNQPPNFVLILNQDVWKNVITSNSINPIVYELIFSNNDTEMDICLAPQLNSTDTPFISTLEIRLLNKSMYIQNLNGNQSALSTGYGLLLWRRINYGAATTDAIRYPKDPYDRIWEANTTGPTLESNSTSFMETSHNYKYDPSQPPAAVMATAISSADRLSFEFPGYGGNGALRMELHFQELGPQLTNMSITFGDGAPQNHSINTFIPAAIVIDQPLALPLDFQFSLNPNTRLGRAFLNAIELFHWTPQRLSVERTSLSDVSAIKEIQAYFKLFQYGQGDPCLPNNYTWKWITCRMDSPLTIVEINLSNFNLSGAIPLAINNLRSLQKIDLSNNNLSGDIPSFGSLLDLNHLDLHSNNLSGEIPSSFVLLPELQYLDVSNNNLCGSLPSFQIRMNFTYEGNNRLCNNDTCSCTSSTPAYISTMPSLSKEKKKRRKYIIAIIFLGALHIVSILAFIFICIYKARWLRKQKDGDSMPHNIVGEKGGVDLKGLPFVSKMFTYKEISDATLNFTKELGGGGFGKVYYGQFSTGEAIAVKMLTDSSKQGLKEFINEVSILSQVRHKNLVSLIGCCVENTYMLIYEYVAKGNIRDLLYGDVKSTIKPLPWTVRIHIALDAAQGLDYLHTGCDPTIIHRDVKSANILLSEKMQAKVADFGLSRLKEGDNTTSHVSTINVLGTAGYLDPVYNATNQLTDKSDVYSFGIVLLELVCGRGPIDVFNTPSHIAEWASNLVEQGKVGEIVDPMLARGYKVESLCKVVDAALQCVDNERSKRPKMSEVYELLQSALEIEMASNESSEDFDGSVSI